MKGRKPNITALPGALDKAPPGTRVIAEVRQWRHLQVQGLSDRRAGPLQDDDAGDRRVHPAFPDPCADEGLPSHPTLWAARQRQPIRKHCARARAARRASTPKRN